ncbi:MAG: AAA family ATPase, partial [Bacteroidales bacterium]|nr:AAA family ATPase [Bacteroidales bacterium]
TTMIYLESFKFPTWEDEDQFLCSYYSTTNAQREAYFHKELSGNYPFGVLSDHSLKSLDFTPITILYGGNGSGKSTALNVISEVLGIKRNAAYNTTVMMERYGKLCNFTVSPEWKAEHPAAQLSEFSKMITSDDIFKNILRSRDKNEIKTAKSRILRDEILDVKYHQDYPRHINFATNEGVEEIKKIGRYKKQSVVQSLSDELGTLEQGYSNGENGLRYLMTEIEEDGLYLLDEPENSMSCKFQQSLAKVIHFSAMRCGAQFIIATHSPFLLAMPDAKIYNLDADPVNLAQWYELENMRIYFELFHSSADLFNARK